MTSHRPNALFTPETRVVPIAPPHRIKTIENLPSGSLKLTQHSGNTFEIAPEDELFQVFAVYTVLADYTR